MSTADEVRAIERAMRPTMIAFLETFVSLMIRPALASAVCFAVLGPLTKPINRSPKKLARLKHSMTVLTIKTLCHK